jgi:ribonuclease HII
VACVDEVGRGALAGPVSVGVAVVTPTIGTAPRGLRDSKLLTARARRELLPRLRRWAVASAVGHADPYEVDAVGLIAALRIAAARAFAELPLDVEVDVALLDGNHDWLRVPAEPDGLFPDPRSSVAEQLADLSALPSQVVTRVKADLTCAGVAAASVLAKCERDAIMVRLAADHPRYGWALNKGYSAPDHIEALRRHGPTPLHRRSWNLPGVGPAGGSPEIDEVASHRDGPTIDTAVDLRGVALGRDGEGLSTASR